MTAWAHLPNAEHIDRVLAHLKAHPERWDATWGAARGAAWDAARGAAWGASRDASRDVVGGVVGGASRDASRDVAGGVAWSAVWGALLALIAYDDCAHYLNLPSGAVRVAASVDIPAAILLLPAVIAMEKRS